MTGWKNLLLSKGMLFAALAGACDGSIVVGPAVPKLTSA